MFITPDSPHNVVKMPVQIARSLDQMNYGVERGEIAPPAFIEIINNAADWCEMIHPIVAREMSRKDAVGICRRLKPTIAEFLEEEATFNKKYEGVYGEAIIAVQRLFENTRILIGETIYIAEKKKIAEQELDQFLLQHFSSQPQKTKDRIVGRKAVMALFE